MPNNIDHVQAKLHKEWEAHPGSYKKPVRKPDAPRRAVLLNCPDTHSSLSYVLYVRGQQTSVCGAGACELLFDDPEADRNATLPLKAKPGFHVYYKDSAFWYGVPKHFDTLADAIPYLQHGSNCVLVEYRN